MTQSTLGVRVTYYYPVVLFSHFGCYSNKRLLACLIYGRQKARLKFASFYSVYRNRVAYASTHHGARPPASQPARVLADSVECCLRLAVSAGSVH